MLDASVRVEILKLLRGLQESHNLAVIYITHDIFQVHKLADRIVIMENGEVVKDARTTEMSAEALEEVIRHGGRVVEKRSAKLWPAWQSSHWCAGIPRLEFS